MMIRGKLGKASTILSETQYLKKKHRNSLIRDNLSIVGQECPNTAQCDSSVTFTNYISMQLVPQTNL